MACRTSFGRWRHQEPFAFAKTFQRFGVYIHLRRERPGGRDGVHS